MRPDMRRYLHQFCVSSALRPLDTVQRTINHRAIVFPGFLPGPDENARVLARRRNSWMDWPTRWLLPALVLVFALGFQSAPASTMVPTHAFEVEEHAHHCKCATRCQGASCCCGPNEARARLSYRETNSEPDRTGASPCMTKSAPCGNSGLPSTPSEGPVNRNAALAVLDHPRLDTVGTQMPFSTRGLLPTRRSSRIDRPPELLILA